MPDGTKIGGGSAPAKEVTAETPAGKDGESKPESTEENKSAPPKDSN